MNIERAHASQHVPLEIERHRNRRPRRWLVFLLGLVLGICIGLALALFR